MGYNNSDRLAIALACLAGVMAIILFLVEKTLLVIVCLLLFMIALLIYPIVHFVKGATWRAVLLAVCLIGTSVFGWHEWLHVKASMEDIPNISVGASSPIVTDVKMSESEGYASFGVNTK